jgi:hypothetical protein
MQAAKLHSASCAAALVCLEALPAHPHGWRAQVRQSKISSALHRQLNTSYLPPAANTCQSGVVMSISDTEHPLTRDMYKAHGVSIRCL